MRPGGLGRIPFVVPLVLLLVTTSGCGRGEHHAGGRMLVVAGIAPMACFAKQVGGSLVEVKLMVPPGASPHTYQPEPDQMRTLSRASVLVLNGVGIEFWAEKAVDAANNPRLVVAETARGLPIIASTRDKLHPGGNPHVWLDPLYAVHQVEAIRDAFARADPANSRAYEHNARRFMRALRRLDADIRAEVKTWRSKSFISFHPAWAYFARRYGLVEADVIEKTPGKEPSPSEIRHLVDTARRIRAKAVFADMQFSTRAAEVVAEEIGAKVILLDPLGRPPDYDYIETMRLNLARMAAALK
ncbi:MAG: metal ABC transporter substrate-binding protein [Armatimonadota bacterium]